MSPCTRSTKMKLRKRSEVIRRLQVEESPTKIKKGLKQKIIKTAVLLKNICMPKTRKSRDLKLHNNLGKPKDASASEMPNRRRRTNVKKLQDNGFKGFDYSTETALSHIKVCYFKEVVQRVSHELDTAEQAPRDVINNLSAVKSTHLDVKNIFENEGFEKKLYCLPSTEEKNTQTNTNSFTNIDENTPNIKMVGDTETSGELTSEISRSEKQIPSSQDEAPCHDDEGVDHQSVDDKISGSENAYEHRKKLLTSNFVENDFRSDGLDCAMETSYPHCSHKYPEISVEKTLPIRLINIEETSGKEPNTSYVEGAALSEGYGDWESVEIRNTIDEEEGTTVWKKEEKHSEENTLTVATMKLLLLSRTLRNDRSLQMRNDMPLDISGPYKDGNITRYTLKKQATYKKRKLTVGGYKLSSHQEKVVFIFSQTFGWAYSKEITNDVTHIIWGNPKLCIRYYLAIAHRSLMLKFSWIMACIRSQYVLNPAPYLISGKGVASCMISNRPQLFAKYTACFDETSKDKSALFIMDVFTQCGGALLDRETLFKHHEWPRPKLMIFFEDSTVVSTMEETLKRNHILPISYIWVCESLGSYKILSFQKYIHPSYEKYFEDDIIEKVVID